MDTTERFDVAERVAVSKARLSEKLSELARRVDEVREKADPGRIARKPWMLAVAGVAGFLVGLRIGAPRAPRVAGAPASPGLGRVLFREILVVAVGSMTKKYLGTGDAVSRKP